MKKTINCPRCGDFLMDFDMKSANGLTCRCRKCGNYVLVKHGTGATKIVDKPERRTASGLRFY